MSLDLTLKNLEFKFNVSDPRENRVFEFEYFRLETASKLLYRDGKQVDITPKAVETLIALAENEGKVISKDELMQKIWADTIVEESNLAQYLHVLRKTLGNTSDGKPYIETLKRRGYRFNGKVSVVKNEISPAKYSEAQKPLTQPPATEPKIANAAPRGNVRVIGNVAVEREEGLDVERTDNIYSVPGWIREPAADTNPPSVTPTRSKRLLPVTIAIVAAVLVVAAFGIYKFMSGGQKVESRSIPFLGSDISRLTTTGRSKNAAISPDGKYVAHTISGPNGDGLYVRQVSAANDILIAGPLQNDLIWTTFSPDGDFIYYLTLARDKGETELFRVPTLGGPAVKDAHDIGAPTFSPDGTKLAYMLQNQEESRLVIADASGMNEAALMSRQAPDYLKANETVLTTLREPDHMNMYWHAPVWSPDGKSIAFPVNQSDQTGRFETVLAVDVETRVERKLTDARWQQAGQPRWLADGLLVSASETSTGPPQLWHISLPGGTASRITRDLDSYEYPSISSDGNTLAAIQEHIVSNIWTVGNSYGDAKQIVSEAGRFNEIIWLADGRIAYTSNASGSSEIWTMNSDGSAARQITSGANARLGLSVTADKGQLIFAAERDGKYNLWRVGLDGSNLTQITNGDGEYYPQCTPDDRWIVYQSGGNFPTLWKMPADGGEAIQITKTTASRPSLSPDGKFVAFHYLDSSFERSQWGIGIISLEDGNRVKRFNFPSTVTERLVKWTPDGKAIAFLNSPGGIPNIWLQPLDGGEPKPITDFPSDKIIAFNWNSDGTNLAVIRGVESSDVLLLNQTSAK